MAPLFLIGYMGSGKTTLGRALQSRGQAAFVDLDEYIEQQAGMTVKEIFAQHGEDGFRLIERDCLRKLAMRQDIVIACGGGTPCFFNNMDVMNRHGVTVWLDVSVDTLHQRLSAARSQRPLIANMDDNELRHFIGRSLDSRRPFYSQASRRFDANHLDNDEQIETSVEHFITSFM